MKNKFRIFTVALFACIFMLGSSVYAFTISNYYDNQNISIGLESMGATQLNITFNGDYTLNGVVYNSGKNYSLKASGSQVDFNGGLYDNLSFIPSNTTNTIKIVSNYTRNYRGTLNFKIDSSSGISKVVPVNTIYIEDYLKGVVGKEMSDYFPMEALKAQAVAARNYALANVVKHNAKGYNLCDTTDCQVYGGYDATLTHVIAAVDATIGKVLLSGTSIVDAFYSANDGGYTEDSQNVWSTSLCYLKTKKDDYDVNYVWSSLYTTTTMNTLLKMKTSLNIPTNYTFVKIDLNSITKFDSGRIKNISLIFKDENGVCYTKSYSKDSARTFLGLQSALYSVSYDPIIDTYTFNGKGNGHGVGMSQIGAKNRATAGQSFDTILKFYYDGTTLLNAATNYTVTFNSQGGNSVSCKNANYNDVITTIAAPEKTGYTFGGWYKEAACLNAWNFTTDKVTSNTTLYAKWTAIKAVTVAIPSNLKVASSSYNSINISFSAVTGASKYEVYRATFSSGSYTLISTITGGSYKNTGLTTNKVYYYKVRAYKMVGTAKVSSGFSTMISAKPILSSPTGIKATRASTKSIKLTWTAAAGASAYEVYRATSNTGTYSLITSIPYLYYTNSGLITSRTYYYKVRSYRTVGKTKIYSNWTTVVNAKP